MFMLIGCAAKMKPLPVFEIQKGSKIGVINFVGPKMKQYHVGTTIFNNFEKEYEVNWDIPGFINSEIKKQASEIGYETVIIEATDSLKTLLANRSIKEGDKLVLNPSIQTALDSLAKHYNIDILYIVEPLKSTIFVPNVEIPVEGYGVGTRNILMIGGVEASAMINGSAICMNPMALTRGSICHKEQDVTGLKMVGNFRQLTDEEKSEYGKVIKGFIKEFVAEPLLQSNLKG